MTDDNEFRTDWEREADEADERQVLQLALLGEDLDDKYNQLARLARVDPVGLCWFGDDDSWVEARLRG